MNIEGCPKTTDLNANNTILPEHHSEAIKYASLDLKNLGYMIKILGAEYLKRDERIKEDINRLMSS